jgi:hypothetical protein
MVRKLNHLTVAAAIVLLGAVGSGAADGVTGASKGGVAPDTAETAANPTQRDFAIRLIQDLNLGSLPKKPKDKHLLDVLDGRRTLVIEAEEHFDKKRDRVTVRPYNAIGKFSGKGWLSGIAEPTAVTFKARIPLAGIYRMTVRGAGNGQLWSIAGRAIKVDCGPQLSDVEVGNVILDAELLNFNVILPPDGAVDVITFTATDLAPVRPAAGWQFTAPLTYGTAAEVGVLLANAQGIKDDPAVPQRLIPVAGTAALPSGASQTTDKIYGRFYAESWLRNGYAPSKVDVPFQVETTGLYGLKINWIGSQLRGTLDGVALEGQGKPYFDWVDLGTHFLAGGKHLLRLDLPASAGIDSIALTAKIWGENASLQLFGWQKPATATVPASDLERLINDIVARYRSARQP